MTELNLKKYFMACGAEIEAKYGKTYDDIFFIKSDVNKLSSFGHLIRSYKYCNKVYYYYNVVKNLWIEEHGHDSIIYRICSEVVDLLDKDKEIITEIFKLYGESNIKRVDFDQLEEDSKNFFKKWNKIYKDHQKASFAKSILEFFNHHITDNFFTDNINVKNQYLFPLNDCNLDLKSLRPRDRIKEQKFTECSKIDFRDFYNDGGGFEKLKEEPSFKIVDQFFLDVCTGNVAKKDYLQKILGYILTGDVAKGRCFFMFYGKGANGKSAVMELMQEIMGYYSKACPTSIILKRAKKSEGSASPEIAVLDYGTRLGILSEIDDGESLNEELIKRISGHDNIEYRPLYQKVKQFNCEASLVMITNNKPFFNLSDSMVDRIRYMEFKSRFVVAEDDEKLPEGHYKRNPNLINDLKTIHLKYVLMWVAIGAQKFFKDGHMAVPDDELLKLENMSYINSCDSINRFINEYCVRDTNAKALKSEVYSTYKKFIEEEKIPKALTKGKFNEEMEEKFSRPVKTMGNTYYFGFSLISNEPERDTGGLDDGL
jgi:P4 family phage/plasmid primase-like protien